MCKIFLFLIFTIVLPLDSVLSACSFNLFDLKPTSPLILKKQGNDWDTLTPLDLTGRVEVYNGVDLELQCLGFNNSLSLPSESQVSKATVHCNAKNEIILGQSRVHLLDLLCAKPPKPATKRAGNCSGNIDKIGIGFQLHGGAFLKKIDVCFHEPSLRTLWTRHKLRAGPKKCNTTGSKAFKNKEFPVPIKTLDAIYRGYDRGHLAPNCDFFLDAERSLTYYYINTAPQVPVFNEVNWRDLEAAIRNAGFARKQDFVVYTGTGGTQKYLKGNRLPVPEFFWKVIIDRTGRGVGFVGINGLENARSPCGEDICTLLKWLKDQKAFSKDPKHVNHGFIFCCRIEAIRQMPNLDLPEMQEYDNELLINF